MNDVCMCHHSRCMSECVYPIDSDPVTKVEHNRYSGNNLRNINAITPPQSIVHIHGYKTQTVKKFCSVIFLTILPSPIVLPH